MNDESPEDLAPPESTGVDAYAGRFLAVRSIDPGLGAYNFSGLHDVILFSDLMSRADMMIPALFRRKPALCAAIIMRAAQWKVDPFALAQEAYQAKEGGPVGYQAKVFVAALQTMAGITLQYEFSGEVVMLDKPATSSRGTEVAKRAATGDRRCTAFAVIDGVRLEYQTPPLDGITIKNSPSWHNDPDQQLSYYAGRGWTRRFRPGVIMGAHSADEVQEMETIKDVTPKEDGFRRMALDARKQAADKKIGFEDRSPIYREGSIIGGDASMSRGDCPYTDDVEQAAEWFAGFDSVRDLQ